MRRLCESPALKALEDCRRNYEGLGLKYEDAIRKAQESSGLGQLEEIGRLARSVAMDVLHEARAAYDPIRQSIAGGVPFTHDFLERENIVRDAFYEVTKRQRMLEEVMSAPLFVESRAIESAQKLWEMAIPDSTQDFVRSVCGRAQDLAWHDPLQFSGRLQGTLGALGDFGQMVRDFPADDFSINPDETVTVSGRIVPVTEIRDVVKGILNSSGLLTEKGFFEGIRALVTEFKNTTSTRKTVLIGLLLCSCKCCSCPWRSLASKNSIKEFSPQNGKR